MAYRQDVLYESEFNCLVTDLVDGFPASIAYDEGTRMYAYDGTTKTVVNIFKLLNLTLTGTLVWYKLG